MSRDLKGALVLQFLTYLVLVLDIPIARQVMGFLYLTFIPGFLLLRILEVRNLDLIETFSISAGLSVAFLMFVGLLTNELYAIGVLRSLSTPYLIIIIGLATLTLSCISCFVRKNSSPLIGKQKKNTKSTRNSKGKVRLLFSILSLLLPFVSISGSLIMQELQNNIVLLLLIVAISALFVVGVLLESVLSNLYPLMIFAMSIALLLHTSLASNYLYGFDVHQEFYAFMLTEKNAHWSPNYPFLDPRTSTYNSMLSITILPTIYQCFLHLEETWIFKITYILLYCFTPLLLYKIYQKQFGKKTAFLSVFLFISTSQFYFEMISLDKQIIAEVFFVMLIILPFLSGRHTNIDARKKTVLFIILSASLVVSHYSMTYIYLFLIFLTWLSSLFINIKPKNITISFVCLFFSTALLWYIYVSPSPFDSILKMGNKVSEGIFSEFFNPASRGRFVLAGLGAGGTGISLGHRLGGVFYYIIEFLILLGAIDVVLAFRRTKSISEYFMMSLIGFGVILLSIVLPFFATALRMERIYHITLIFLAPFCILGVDFIFRYIARMKFSFARSIKLRGLFISFLLIGYFLVSVGFIYEITGDVPTSVPLSGYRMDKVTLYNYIVCKQEVFGAKWLSQNMNPSLNTYADIIGIEHLLTSYGLIPPINTYLLSNDTRIEDESYIYFRFLNIEGLARGYGGDTWRIPENATFLYGKDKIYSNGGSHIYKGKG